VGAELHVVQTAKGRAMKHPGPWTVTDDIAKDASGESVFYCYTDDPETRAILTHAAEMWEELQDVTSVEPGTSVHRQADKSCCDLVRKIESEIAAAKGDGT
jgi:hypothetical protein